MNNKNTAPNINNEFFRDLMGVDSMELPKAKITITLQEYDGSHRKYVVSETLETSMAIVDGDINENNCRLILTLPPDMKKESTKIQNFIKKVMNERANPPKVGGQFAPANVTITLRSATQKYDPNSYFFAHSPRDIDIEKEGFLFNKTTYITLFFMKANTQVQAKLNPQSENKSAPTQRRRSGTPKTGAANSSKNETEDRVDDILNPNQGDENMDGGDKIVNKTERELEQEKEDNLACNILTGSDDPHGEMDGLIGLDAIKTKIRDMEARMILEKRKEQMNKGEKVSANRHMIFYGEPGTGKTTVARIITGILFNMGLIRENKCVEINGEFLKGQYLGASAPKTQRIVNRALGGVLFIDEAYAIMDKFSSGGGFGDEVINTLLTNMENHQDDLIVIFAGYENEMLEFLDQNPGLKSRISDRIEFIAYKPHELLQIFDMRLKKHGFNITQAARLELFKKLSDAYAMQRTSGDNGNARYAANIVERILDVHATKCIDLAEDDPNIFIIQKETILEVFEKEGIEQMFPDEDYPDLPQGAKADDLYYKEKHLDPYNIVSPEEDDASSNMGYE